MDGQIDIWNFTPVFYRTFVLLHPIAEQGKGITPYRMPHMCNYNYGGLREAKAW